MSKTLLYGIVALLLIVGGTFFFANYGDALPDPHASISVPPPPESPTTTPSSVSSASFVPVSSEFSQERAEPKSSTGGAPKILNDICVGVESNNFFCYEEHYVKLVKEHGITAAFDDLKTRYPTTPYVVAQCHPLTHVIGREAALMFKTPGEAYKDGEGFCWSGYYHGILETFLGKIGRNNLPQEINGICDSVEGKARYSFDYYNCVHGLGHGVMAITDTELFQSLAYCDLLEGDWEQQSCASGAYMENVIVDGLNHFTKYLKPEEPLYPCTESPDKYKNTCYLMQTSYILKVNGGDFLDTFAWCRKAEELYRATCFQSLGRDASGRNSSEVAATRRSCLLGADFFERSNCVVGAVKDITSYFDSDTEAKKFCVSFDDEELRNVCDETATSYYSLF